VARRRPSPAKGSVSSGFHVDDTGARCSCRSCTFPAHLEIFQVNHKRTFFYLEQLILKHGMHRGTTNLKEVPDGIDFYFSHKNGAIKLNEFLQATVPIRSVRRAAGRATEVLGARSSAHAVVIMVPRGALPHGPRTKTSQELVSFDEHTSSAVYKWTFSTEIVPICKVCRQFDL